MHPSEAEIIPYNASSIPDADSVIVFAPHPDDEVFGCGGTLAQHAVAGHRVYTILLTAGEHGVPDNEADSYRQVRQQESRAAAQILKIPSPLCWELPDRQVVYGEALVAKMTEAIRNCEADVVYAPSPWELHPDHRAASLAAQEAVRRLGGEILLCMYEVSAPLRPNTLINITSVWDQKQQAMQAFESQNGKLPYSSFISALNRFRALTLYPTADYAEGFEVLTGKNLAAGGLLAIEGEKNRLLRKNIPVVPRDVPLVSVIVRTMGRSTLPVALNSLALQTYSNVQLVLVDALGQGLLAPVSNGVGSVSSCIVSTGSRLGRSAAANAGMSAAEGEYFIFLDDDDWLYPDHISKLVGAIRQSVGVNAVHTAVECVDEKGQPLGEIFDFPYAIGELKYGNFMPIHSVLFNRILMEQGCSFNVDFDLYEDWDFWLQVEAKTAIGFVGGVSAAYRIHPGAGDGVQAESGRSRAATEQLYKKWGVMQSAETFNELVTRALSRRSTLRQLNFQVQEARRLAVELQLQQQEALSAQQLADSARQDAHQLRQAHDHACMDRDFAVNELSQARMQWLQDQSSRIEAQNLSARLHAELKIQEIQIQLTQNHVANIEHALDETRQALDATRQDLDVTRLSLLDSRRQIEDLLSSTSWKISSPVRWLGRRIVNLRNIQRVLDVASRRGIGWAALVRRSVAVYRRAGWGGVRQQARRALHPDPLQEPVALNIVSELPAGSERTYLNWINSFDHIGDTEAKALRQQFYDMKSHPLVSLVMPVYAPQRQDILHAIESVKNQIYSNWELCICDDASPDSSIKEWLRNLALADSRIKLVFHETNLHISCATNSAIAIAKGKYIAFIDQDDELSAHAVLNVVQAFMQNPELKLVYSDEDKIDGAGKRFDPYFKTDFNLGLLRSHNFMCHFAVYESVLLEKLGGLRMGFEGAQDYDLALRAVDSVGSRAIGHIPKVLYHWRTAVGSTASGHSNKSYAFDAGRRALAEHLIRRGLHADVEKAPEAPGMYRLIWQHRESMPLISIIIPTRNGYDILRQCLDSIRQTKYKNYEIIVVDNGSDDCATLELLEQRTQNGQIRVLNDDRPFNFSALNNRAVREASRGDFVLLLNNDIEITHPDWLDEMIGPAMEDGVGCVGARLWYPDGRLQHGGVILVCGVAGHAHKFLPRGRHGYMGRAVLAQDFVAVTAACLLVRKSIFEEVGGLDESLAVAFNDVDFCLKVHSAGYRNHWTPYAELIHHESLTRGYEDTPEKQQRFRGEVDILQSRWASLLRKDPCYNPNLTVHAEDFSLAWPSRVGVTSIPAQ